MHRISGLAKTGLASQNALNRIAPGALRSGAIFRAHLRALSTSSSRLHGHDAGAGKLVREDVSFHRLVLDDMVKWSEAGKLADTGHPLGTATLKNGVAIDLHRAGRADRRSIEAFYESLPPDDLGDITHSFCWQLGVHYDDFKVGALGRIMGMFDTHIGKGAPVICAMREGHVIGISYLAQEVDEPGTGYAYGTVIHPDFEQMGVGTELKAAQLGHARDLGLGRVISYPGDGARRVIEKAAERLGMTASAHDVYSKELKEVLVRMTVELAPIS